MSHLRRHINAIDRALRSNPDADVIDLSTRRRDTSPMMAVAPVVDARVDAARRHGYLPAVLHGVPPSSVPGTDLALWTWEGRARDGKTQYFAVVFHGRAARPLLNGWFRTEASRQNEIDRLAESRHARRESHESAHAQRRAFVSSLKVGDILYTSWGYEQTNVDFYEVVEVSGKSAVIRKVAQQTAREGSSGADYVVPVPGRFVGPLMRKLVGQGNVLKIEDHHASPWNGTPKYQTAMGWGH